MTVLAMSHGELSRFDTLMRVERGELRVDDAAALLGLKRRQVFRLTVLLVWCPASAVGPATGGTAMRCASGSLGSCASTTQILGRRWRAST